MSTKSQEVIWGARIMGAQFRAREAADGRSAWLRPASQPSPTMGQCLNGGLAWLEVECTQEF